MTLFVMPFEDKSIKEALQKYWIIFDLFRPKLVSQENVLSY